LELLQGLYGTPIERPTVLIDDENGRLFNYKVWTFQNLIVHKLWQTHNDLTAERNDVGAGRAVNPVKVDTLETLMV